MIETRGVVAGAYRGRDIGERALLTHALDTERGVSLCRRQDEGSLADPYAHTEEELQSPPTCPVCLKRDPRFGGRYRPRK